MNLSFQDLENQSDNTYIESFNRRFRDECLNTNWFFSLEDAK
ncbi:integrase core domain-containing protein [Sphingobacterium faecium]